MNKLIRLSPTGIEYGDYAWNFASGCGNNIDGKCKSGGFKCWAYLICQRFEDHYPNGFKPTIYPEALLSPLYLKKPSRILCAFMGDLFWDCPEFNPERVLTPNLPNPIPSACFTLHGTQGQLIFGVARACPQHAFLFLTKQPQNLKKSSPFPDNCWVGVSAWDETSFVEAYNRLICIEARTKYISLEPFLGWGRLYEKHACKLSFLLGNRYDYPNNGIDWVIIGAQTKPTVYPKIEWVREIVEACGKADIPVFLKDNLKPLLLQDAENNIYSFPEWAGKQFAVASDHKTPMRLLRQEMPSIEQDR